MAASNSKRPLPGFSRFNRPSKALTGGVPLTGGNPSGFILQDTNGKDWYYWFDTNGSLHYADAATVETAGFNFLTGGTQALQETVNQVLLASTVSMDIWIADRPCIVTGVKTVQSVVGGAGAVVTPRKITDTSAPGAGTSGTVKNLITAAASLTSTINTPVAATLSATPSDYTFAAGDRLSLLMGGTLTGLVGLIVISYVPIG